MKDNAGQFLRRVSIICLEDAMLHPDMPLLVWLMCAQAKGYTMGAAAASACLQIVYQLACVPVRDRYPIKPAELSTGRPPHALPVPSIAGMAIRACKAVLKDRHKICMSLQLAETDVPLYFLLNCKVDCVWAICLS